MRTRLFLAALLVSLAIACSSGPSYYLADALVPAPARATDSLRDLVFTRVRGLGFKVYEAHDAVARLAELNTEVYTTSDFLYAEREGGLRDKLQEGGRLARLLRAGLCGLRPAAESDGPDMQKGVAGPLAARASF